MGLMTQDSEDRKMYSRIHREVKREVIKRKTKCGKQDVTS